MNHSGNNKDTHRKANVKRSHVYVELKLISKVQGTECSLRHGKDVRGRKDTDLVWGAAGQEN